jgi:serine/threonine protein kinase
MADVPTSLGRRFYTSDSGELRHNSIHDRNTNNSSSHHDGGSDSDEHQHQQRQHHHTPTLSLQKPPMVPLGDVPLVAVQVVDRLRWWRTHRVREQPLPLHHYVFRGNYTNYSSFGTRPLSPGLTRLLQKARSVRAQHLRYQQFLQRQQLRQRGTSATSSAIDEAEHRQQPQPQQLEQLTREDSDLLDNKRTFNAAALPLSVAATSAAPLTSLLDSPTHASVDHDAATPHASTFPSTVIAPSTTIAVPPLGVAAIGSSLGTSSLTSSVNCPSEQEVHEADRLLRLFQPRAASVPVRSRRQRRVAGYEGTSSAQPHAVHARGADERTSRSTHLTCVPTSDDMTDVCYAAGAADTAVVLHHEPRLVIYERDLNPRTALRAARVSCDALEGLRDAAAESSTEVFALANLPLSTFERFFYQQQLYEGRHDDTAPDSVQRAREATGTVDGNHTDGGANGASLDRGTFPSAPLHRDGGADTEVYPPGYGVVNREDALYFGSPLAITSPVFSPRSRTPESTTSAGPEMWHHAAVPRNFVLPGSTTEQMHAAACRGNGRRGSWRRHQQWASLRAVSVPCLPRVYKGGYPQLLSPAASATISSAAAEASPCAATAAAVIAQSSRRGGRDGAGAQRSIRRRPIPPALRLSSKPQDGAHLCHRVDDLQDVYAFNPIFDAIGRGAFSKVYAAVPILRGRDGMRRFHTMDEHCTVATGTHPKEGRSTSPVSSPPAPKDLQSSLMTKEGGQAVTDANTLTTASPSPAPPAALATTTSRRTAALSVPVVALKVIPRKARQKEQRATAVDFPTSATKLAQQQPPSAELQGDADANSSVRRELVEIEREVSILRRLHHTGCSHFYEALRSPDAFAIAMRVYPGSMDARHYLSRYGPPSEARTALALFQLVSTVHYLHTHFGLIHRDIKLENLLFSEVESSVTNACICEVLGSAVHKTDPAAAEDDVFVDTPLMHGGRNAETAAAAAAKTYEVMRLLRVTLIDFGLARRTRTSGGMSMNWQRTRGGNTRNQSLSASMNSPANLTGGFVAPPSNPIGVVAVGLNTNSTGNSVSLQSPTVVTGATASVATPCSISSVLQQQQQQQQSQQMSMPAVGSVTIGAAGTAATFTTTLSSNNSYAAAPDLPPPLCPTRLCRSPSTTAYGVPSWGGPGASRVGMPSPMPSTANMFTRFLDLDEDLDEEESVANGASTTGLTEAAGAFSAEVAKGTCEASVTSPYAAPSFRPHGSCAGFPEEDCATSSTDVSASETESDVDRDDEDEEEEGEEREEGRNEVGTHSRAASSDESEATITTLPVAGLQEYDQDHLNVPTPARFAQQAPPPPPLPSPHTQMRISFDGASQTLIGVSGGGGGGSSAADTPPTRHHHLPSSQNFHLRDDTEATLLLTPCGTEKYLPPEVLSWILERGWTRRSTTVGLARAMDMYAIGIVAYVLLSGCFPFNASSRATLLHQQQRVPRCNSTRWSGVSGEAITFVQKLLEPNPLKRMTAKEALDHPFLLEVRQLAEKLSLVPHGEGESVIHSSSNGARGDDGQPGNRAYGANTSGNGGTHGLMSENSLRTHWSTSGTNMCTLPPPPPQQQQQQPHQQLSLPSTTFADRTRGAEATNIGTPRSGANGSCHRTSCHGSPARGGNQPTLAVPGQAVALKSSTPDAPFAAAAATPLRDTSVHSSSNSNNNSRGGSGEAAFLHRADDAPSDMLAAVAREIVGTGSGSSGSGSRPPLREVQPSFSTNTSSLSPQHSPSLVSPVTKAVSPATDAVFAAPATVASSETPAAPQAARPPPASAASMAPVPLKTVAVATKPSPTPMSPACTKGGGDDLFESLYNNIMFSD